MKRILMLVVCFVGLLCGCSQKPDPRVADLEAQVSGLKADLSALDVRTTGLESLVKIQGDLLQSMRVCQTNDEDDIIRLQVASSKGPIDPNTGLPFSNSPTTAIDPNTGLPVTPDAHVVRVANRVTESNDVWWRWALTVYIANPGGLPAKVNVKVSFLDKDGFVIDTKDMDGLQLDGQPTSSFSDFQLVSLPGAQRVASIKGEVVE